MADKGADREAPQVEQMALDDLHPDPANARQHSDRNIEAIRASLARFGQTKPLVVQASSGRILAGNGTYQAMRLLGWQRCAAVRVAMTDLDATAYGIADNRTGELAAWDLDALDGLVAELEAADMDIGDVGFVDTELDALLGTDGMPMADGGAGDGSETPGQGAATADGAADTPAPDTTDYAALDEAPEPPKKPVTKPGDVWTLGRHTLICGDSREMQTFALLLGKGKADMVFTDPPYNVAGSNRIGAAKIRDSYKRLQDSSWDQDFVFSAVEKNIVEYMAADCAVYVCTSHIVAGDIWSWMRQWAEKHGYCVWVKNNPMPSLNKRHYTWATELVCYGTRGKHVFNFPQEGHALNVWPISKSTSNALHPTMKPVAVPAHAIAHSSKAGQTVLDPFGGAGSTLLACEKLGRVCRTIEIDPAYCDVIVQRWEALTGNKATRAGDAKPAKPKARPPKPAPKKRGRPPKKKRA